MGDFQKISNLELGRKSAEEYQEARKMPISVLLEDVRSLHNVGSVFRTADAFGVERIYLTGITGHPPHRDIHKTALGAQDVVPWIYEKDPVSTVKHLKKEGYKLMAVEQVEPKTLLHRIEVPNSQKQCLIFGNEIKGVSEQLLAVVDGAVEIPQMGTKHSLNISVSVGVVLWEYFRRLYPGG